MKIIIGIIAALLLLIIGFFFTQSNLTLFGAKTTATIKNQTFSVDVVKTPKDKQVGLSSKTSIASNYAMYFPFDKPDYYAFWMKDMKFPIDIIFLRDGKIVSITHNAPIPPVDTENLPIYQPEEPANAVLEISAGLAQKYGFVKGDTVTFKNLPK